MDKHVVDLETAKKLADYLPEGWEVNYWWHLPRVQYDPEKPNYYLMTKPVAQLQGLNSIELYPAPILSEMQELLPKYVEFEEGKLELRIGLSWDSQYRIGYYSSDNSLGRFIINESPNLATAAAKLYIWLVDEGYLEESDEK